MSKRIDLTGQKVGKLTVIKIVGKDKFNHTKWLCKCECGNDTVVLSDNLKRNHSLSCGCNRIEKIVLFNKTHGMRNERIYYIWESMIDRCENPKNKRYTNYGGRGIKVCSEWHRFENFYNDMKNSYTKTLTLDRIDVNGNYEPNNCRWATMKEQQNNRSNNKVITYKGESLTLSALCEKYNLNYATTNARISKLNWSVEKATKTPIRQRKAT